MPSNFDVAIAIRSSPLFRDGHHSIVIFNPAANSPGVILQEIERFQRQLQTAAGATVSASTVTSSPSSLILTQFAAISLACGDGRLYRANGGASSDAFCMDVKSDAFFIVVHQKLGRRNPTALASEVENLICSLPLQGPPGTLVSICSSDAAPAISTACAKLKLIKTSNSDWAAYQVRAPYFGPTANMATAGTLCPPPQSCYPRFHDELLGPVENVCLGVALGIIKQLPVSASKVAGVVPIDLAVHNAVLLLAMGENHQLPSSLRASRKGGFTEIVVAQDHRDALVWGMVGEFVIDYLGRYLPVVHQSSYVPAAADMLEPNPSLDFETQFNDLWNWGISLTAPMIWYRSFYASKFQKSHLKRFPHSTTAERMLNILNTVDATIEFLQPPATVAASSSLAGGSGRMLDDMMQSAQRTLLLKRGTNSGCDPEASAAVSNDVDDGQAAQSYLALLRMLERGGANAQQHLSYVSLDWVAWEMYVKRVCVAVLEFFVRHVFDHRDASTSSFPAPTWSFHNALVFSGPDRAPPTSLLLRRVFTDLHWALRCGQQSNGNMIRLHAGGTPQRQLAILAQPHIQLLLNQLAREQNVSKEAIEQRAHSILVGIGDTMNHQQLRTFGYGIKKVFQTLYHRINLNPESFERLFRAFHQPRCAVVIIPSHRSYVDFLVVSYLLVMMGFPVPHICSGEDFLRLGSLSDLLRGSGAFFMRRSFRSDRLYGALFKEYIRHLVRDRQCLEFFIEGMRSRTGKTMPPKLGILKFVTDAFFEKQDEIDDVLFVPVGLSYEKLLEGNVYAEELMGIPKPKETVGNLIKSASILKSNFGALNVEIGEFVSLRSFAEDPHQCPPGYERTPEVERVAIKSSSSSVSAGGGTYTPVRVLANVAWRITYELQKNVVVTPTALLSAVMVCCFDPAAIEKASGSVGIPAAAIASNVEWLRSAVLHRHGKMNANFAVCDGSQLMSYALQLLQPRIWMSPLSHVFLQNESLATTQMLFWVYSNQLLHVFADEAIVVLCAFAFGKNRRGVVDGKLPTAADVSAARDARRDEGNFDSELHVQGDANGSPTADTDVIITLSELRQKCRLVRALLATDVPNSQRPCPYSLDSWLATALTNLYEDSRSIRRLPFSVSTAEDDVVVEFTRNTFTSFVAQLLFPLIESAWIVAISAMGCVAMHHYTVTEATLLQVSYDVAIALHRKKFTPYVHSANRETLKSSLNTFLDCGAFQSAAQGTIKLQSASASSNATQLTAESLEKLQKGPTTSVAALQLPKAIADMMDFTNQIRWRPADHDAMKEVHAIVQNSIKSSLAAREQKSKI